MENRTHKRGENQQMSSVADVSMARDYIAAIGGPGKGVTIIGKAFNRLSELFPHEGNKKDQWIYRRVRSFWEREAPYVKFREMAELHRAAAIAKAERELIAQARKEHAAFIEKTAHLRALLEHQDAAFHSDQIEGLGRVTGRMDRAGDRGER